MAAEAKYKLCPQCRSIYPGTAKVCGQDRTELVLSEDIVAGRYVKVRQLGQGGMGTVFEAWEPALKRRVALKTLNIGSDLWKYYEREAEALGRLLDEHIITVYERGRDEPYIAMEYLEGQSLDRYLAEKGRLPLRTSFRLWRQAVRGVVVAHKAGIVHRDLKPANLFLTQRLDESGNPVDLVKVLDFGIAILDEGPSRPSKGAEQTRKIGTLGFAAPEQWKQGRASAASDVYSLGVVLLAMLTGQQGFADPRRTLEKVFASFSCSPELLALTRDTLAEDPAQRPLNAEVLLQRISMLPEVKDPARFWPDEPLAAPPSIVSVGERRYSSDNLAPPTMLAKKKASIPSPAQPDAHASPPPKPAAAPGRSEPELEPADSENETEQMRATSIPLPFTRGPAKAEPRSDAASTDKLPQNEAASEASASIGEAAAQLSGNQNRAESATLPPTTADKITSQTAPTIINTPPQPAHRDESAALVTLPFLRARAQMPVSSGGEFLGALRTNPLLRKSSPLWLILGGSVISLPLILLIQRCGVAESPEKTATAPVIEKVGIPAQPSPAPPTHPEAEDGAGSRKLIESTSHAASPASSKPAGGIRSAASGPIKVSIVYCPGVTLQCGRESAPQPANSRGTFQSKLRPSEGCRAERDGKIEQLSHKEILDQAGPPDHGGTYHIYRNQKSSLCR